MEQVPENIPDVEQYAFYSNTRSHSQWKKVYFVAMDCSTWFALLILNKHFLYFNYWLLFDHQFEFQAMKCNISCTQIVTDCSKIMFRKPISTSMWESQTDHEVLEIDINQRGWKFQKYVHQTFDSLHFYFIWNYCISQNNQETTFDF